MYPKAHETSSLGKFLMEGGGIKEEHSATSPGSLEGRKAKLCYYEVVRAKFFLEILHRAYCSDTWKPYGGSGKRAGDDGYLIGSQHAAPHCCIQKGIRKSCGILTTKTDEHTFDRSWRFPARSGQCKIPEGRKVSG